MEDHSCYQISDQMLLCGRQDEDSQEQFWWSAKVNMIIL